MKLLKIILQIILVLSVVLLSLNYSFIISFEIKDFVYSFSSNIFLIIFLIFFIIIFLLQNLYFKTNLKINNYKLKKFISNKEKGYDAFLQGMIALSNKDFKKAAQSEKNISKYLSDKPSLALLLKSEIFKIEKKFDLLSLTYEEMTKNKDTENLAYRGLMEQYLKAHDYHHAFIYGQKLFNKNPYVEKIYETLVNIIAKTNNWQELLNITESAYIKKIINKGTFQENKSIALYEIAQIKKLSETKNALKLIDKALNLRRNFAPYIKLRLDILLYLKNYNYAKKFLKKSWSENPHSEYKSLFFDLAKNLDLDPLVFTKQIISSLKSEESKILLVEASIVSKKWEEARNTIKTLLDNQPKKEVCILMAKIEEGESNDINKSNSWMFRSKNGIEKNMWVCLVSNQFQNKWSSVSEAGFFNSLEWRVPNMLNQNEFNEKNLFYENK